MESGIVPTMQFSSHGSQGKLAPPTRKHFRQVGRGFLSLRWDSGEVMRPQWSLPWIRLQPRWMEAGGWGWKGPGSPLAHVGGAACGKEATVMPGLLIFLETSHIPNVTCNCTASKCRYLRELLFKRTSCWRKKTHLPAFLSWWAPSIWPLRKRNSLGSTPEFQNYLFKTGRWDEGGMGVW